MSMNNSVKQFSPLYLQIVFFELIYENKFPFRNLNICVMILSRWEPNINLSYISEDMFTRCNLIYL